MEIRIATLDDVICIAPLIYSAAPELYDFLYKTVNHDSKEFIEFEFCSGRGFCGYKNVTVIAHENLVVGTGCFFNQQQYIALTLGTVANMFKFYGRINIWPVLARTMHVESVMKCPRKGELYLSNFGVNPEYQGQGFGTSMIQQKLKEAQASDYAIFGLDVASTNPQAEKLYQRLGLSVVEEKSFSGKRKGHSVPNSKKMELDLNHI